MDTVLDIIVDSALDCLKPVVFLFLAYLLMEFTENRASDKMQRAIKSVGKGGPAVGGLLGCFPQCGFSAAASNLYAAGMVSTGTLIAVYLSTSDEAIPLLLGEPQGIKIILKLILCKIVIGIAAGYAVDAALKIFGFKKAPVEMCADCGCGEEKGSIFKSALYHTLHITIFIFVINIILNSLFAFAGEEEIKLLLSNVSAKWYMPFITALFGLIPNCGSSVVITELYISGGLSFGAAVAGLCSGAGIGLAVLFKSNTKKSENIMIVLLLYFIAVLAGLIFQLIKIS